MLPICRGNPITNLLRECDYIRDYVLKGKSSAIRVIKIIKPGYHNYCQDAIMHNAEVILGNAMSMK
jgi:hypothetical protein